MDLQPTAAEHLCHELAGRIRSVKGGTLRIWGDWFGRPMDNVHNLRTCSAEGDLLTLVFSEGERLDIWNPSDVVIDANRFEIGQADRVRWRWYRYGEAQSIETLHSLDYLRDGDSVRLRSDVGYRPPESTLAPAGPAAELL